MIVPQKKERRHETTVNTAFSVASDMTHEQAALIGEFQSWMGKNPHIIFPCQHFIWGNMLNAL